ncbi:hypothetical protein KIPB_014931, partial [Kipferlia bialata]
STPLCQRGALEAIYDSTNGPEWTVANNWLSADPHCTWTGVTCNAAGWVNELDLSEFGLTGALPADIGCFPFLQTLYANNNQMTSPIPDEICNLTNLKFWQMVDAGLIGDLPTCMCT